MTEEVDYKARTAGTIELVTTNFDEKNAAWIYIFKIK
jgi:hypothetical protein